MEEMKQPDKKPMPMMPLVAAGIVIAAIAAGVGFYLGGFSHELNSQILGISSALQRSGSEPAPLIIEKPVEPTTPPPAPAEEPKPDVNTLLKLSAGSSVSVPVELEGGVVTMKLTLVSIEGYGTSKFKAHVLAVVTKTPTGGATTVIQPAKAHTFTLDARAFDDAGFDVVMAGYAADHINVTVDYKPM